MCQFQIFKHRCRFLQVFNKNWGKVELKVVLEIGKQSNTRLCIFLMTDRRCIQGLEYKLNSQMFKSKKYMTLGVNILHDVSIKDQQHWSDRLSWQLQNLRS